MSGQNRRLGRYLLWLINILVFLYLTFQVFVIVPISFSSSDYLEFPPKGFSLKWYNDYFSDPGWISATIMSFKLGLATMFVSSVIGTLAALGIIRGQFRGKHWLQILIISPIIIPVIILSVSIYGFFAKLHLVGNFLGMVIGHSLLAIPYVFISVAASLQGLDVNLEKASYSLGANRIQTFFRVTFPLIRPGIMTGAVFAFIISFDELVVTMFISGVSYTLPVRMWMDIRLEISPTISTISTLLIIMSFGAMLSVEWIRRRTERRYH